MSRNSSKTTALTSASIDKFSYDGRGLAKIAGKTTFIEGALPGEIVEFKYSRKKIDYDEGRAITVKEQSLNRITPACKHYGNCGGCSWQHLSGNYQILTKQTLVLELLERTGRCVPETVYPALTAKPWHYRDRARLSVRYVNKKNTALIGFRERYHSRLIADIDSCEILNKLVSDKLLALRQLINSFIDPCVIAQIELAAGDKEIGLIFRNLRVLAAADEQKLVDFAKQTGFKIYLQPKGYDSVYLLYPKDNPYLQYRLPDKNLIFEFLPTDFTQINQPINQQMVNAACSLMKLDACDRVGDLFCGLGNFSLPLSFECQAVLGVEISQTMVERAYHNARLNNIANAEFTRADLMTTEALSVLKAFNCNKLLLDPPRAGAFEIVKHIALLKPQTIVYISCNPATLARDANILVNDAGYVLKGLGVMDMFAQTTHVESMALFEKE